MASQSDGRTHFWAVFIYRDDKKRVVRRIEDTQYTGKLSCAPLVLQCTRRSLRHALKLLGNTRYVVLADIIHTILRNQ